jgi:hypothetical protein
MFSRLKNARGKKGRRRKREEGVFSVVFMSSWRSFLPPRTTARKKFEGNEDYDCMHNERRRISMVVVLRIPVKSERPPTPLLCDPSVLTHMTPL